VDIQLPDGTVLQGVPDGTTKADILAKLRSNGRDTAAMGLEDAPVKPEASMLEGAARGAAPYALGMGGGALVGGGLGALIGGGLPGAIVGASLGARAAPALLAAGDIGTSLYNTVANRFGYGAAPTPSDTLKNVAGSVGVGKPGAPVTEALIGGALGGGLMAAGLRGAQAASPVTQGVINAMAAQPGLQTAAGGAGAATSAAMQEYGGVENPIALLLANMAGGAAVPAGIGAARLGAKGVTAGVNRFSVMADPEAAAWLRSVEGRGPEVVAALRANADSPVPGYNRTAAQASVEAGAPGLQALGRQVGEVSSAAPYARTLEQEGAVRDAVRRVGGTADELATMKSARSEEATANYGKSDVVRVEADDALTEMMGRPDMRRAISQARRAAENKGETFGTKAEDGPTTYTGEELHRIKVALDDMMENAPQTNVGTNLKNSIKGLQSDFMEWVGTRVPEYDVARNVFKAQSQFINQAEVGRFLEKKLFGPIEGKGMSPAPFIKAIDEPPAKIIEKVPDLTPQQRKTLSDVTAELTRDVQAKRLATAGSAAAPKITATATDVAPAKLNLLNRTYTLATALMDRMQGALNKENATRIAAAMLEPEMAAARIEAAVARQAKFDRFKVQGPDSMGKGAFAASQIPGITNAMSPYGELNRNAMAR
jgi:hypothetical protein